MFIKKILQTVERINSELTFKNEDKPVFDFLANHQNKNLKYLEAGFGLARFLDVISKKFGLVISGIEINSDLVRMAKSNGYDVVEGNILAMPFSDSIFDIVHCSHVIEHFKYPEIIQVLDELFRVVKKGGYVILRSPLMNQNFFDDIDHVRPYPPESIMNYFNNPQQQIVGGYKIKEISRWYRTENCKVILTNKYLNIVVNLFFSVAWILFRFPHSKKNGYVLILQKV